MQRRKLHSEATERFKLLEQGNWNLFSRGMSKSKLDKEICDLFIEDHMTRITIRELIKKDPERFSKILTSLYKKKIFGDPTKKNYFNSMN